MDFQTLRPATTAATGELTRKISELLTGICHRPDSDELFWLEAIENNADLDACALDDDVFNRSIVAPVELVIKYKQNGFTYLFNTVCCDERCSHCGIIFYPDIGFYPKDFKGNIVCETCGDRPEPETRKKKDVPNLDIRTDQFRERFPTDAEFFDWIYKRNETAAECGDDFSEQLSNTVSKCRQYCGCYTAMSDFIGIAYVELDDAASKDELADNFFGCPSCFLKHLKMHKDKIGRIGF